ncbi:MAG: POTRA domain-containing protein [Bryobacteraceae bacterium]
MPLVVVVLLSLAFSLNGQSQTAGATPSWPIGSLSVEGNSLYADEEILRLAGLRTGQTAGEKEFDAARDRLLATGLFESVGYSFKPAATGKKYTATIEVDEIDQVFPYRFEGIQAEEPKLKEFLKEKEPLLGEKIPATEAILNRFTERIETYLAGSGQPQEITGRLVPEASGDLMVIFRPAQLPSVAEVKFTGNKLLPENKLQLAVAGTAIGAAYTEPRFQQILTNTIRPLYEELGHVRVSFPKLETSEARGVRGILVTVHVDEGHAYTLRNVELAGPMSRNEELLKEGRFATGETANFHRIGAGVEAMLQSLRRNGYLTAEAQTERKIDDQAKELDLVVAIEPGERYTFGNLTINGLDIQTEPHIRKAWAMERGSPYNAEYPEYFLARLRQDGIFENLGTTKSTKEVNEEANTVDVTLHFARDAKPLPRIGPDVPKRKAP